jgi:hypothetical protein
VEVYERMAFRTHDIAEVRQHLHSERKTKKSYSFVAT